MTASRTIPSIDVLLQRPGMVAQARTHGRSAVVDALRTAADAWRADPHGEAGPWIEAHATAWLARMSTPSLTPVINATGVIVHTNLGRAPLAKAAVERAAAIASGYSNLEYDLAAGARGSRHVHAEQLLCALTGAEAAVVTGNNAAATMLVLATLATGREVLVSRGELVEIGGGFRVPDIMAQSGAVLREVGTTNRTRISDYAAAISDRTAMILRVHPSNFRIEGFTERPSLTELATLAHRFQLPLFEDLGSGWPGVPHTTAWPGALRNEPSVRDGIAAGVDLLAFSGDKLLGGPQCGLIVGRAPLIEKLRAHPFMRAVRAGKQTYAALEATLALWQREPSRTDIPVVAMLVMPTTVIEQRARALASAIQGGNPQLRCDIVDGASTIGGGAAPQSVIPTRLLSITSATQSADALEAALRAGTPAVIARIQQDAVLVDLRTVQSADDQALTQAIMAALARSTGHA